MTSHTLDPIDCPPCPPPSLALPSRYLAACQRELGSPDGLRFSHWMRGIDRLAADFGAQLVAQASFDDEAYTRTRVYLGAEVELWLLGWLPGQASGAHDHGGADSAYVVLAGALEEEIFTLDDRGQARVVEVRRVTAGGVVSADGHAIHRVRVVGSTPLVSLHLFAPRFVGGRDFEPAEAA